jgi:DNA-binding transcriptional LysR family regulator
MHRAFNYSPVMANSFDLTSARHFVAIAEEGSIAAAARRENITASAVSKRISELEQRYGVVLLNRHSDGVELTSVGANLLRRARNLLREAESLENDLLSPMLVSHGRVRIVASESMIVNWLPEFLKDFSDRHPGVSFDLDEQLSAGVASSVRTGTADMGIFVGEADVRGLDVTSIHRDRLVVVVAREHPLASQGHVKLESLLGYHIIGHDQRAGMQPYEKCAWENGWQVRSAIRVNGLDAACRLSEAGLGIAIVSDRTAQIFARSMNVCIVQLDEAWASRIHRVCIKEDTNLPAAAQELYNELLLWRQDKQ